MGGAEISWVSLEDGTKENQNQDKTIHYLCTLTHVYYQKGKNNMLVCLIL